MDKKNFFCCTDCLAKSDRNKKQFTKKTEFLHPKYYSWKHEKNYLAISSLSEDYSQNFFVEKYACFLMAFMPTLELGLFS